MQRHGANLWDCRRFGRAWSAVSSPSVGTNRGTRKIEACRIWSMSRSVALVLTLIVLLNLPGISARQAAVPASGDTSVSATRIRADVEFLADDLLEGREAGTRGHELAARYAATALKAAGYAPGADDGTYFQQVPFIESTPTATSMRLTIDGATTDVPLPDEGMVGASASQATAEVTAPVVFAGFGVTAPEFGLRRLRRPRRRRARSSRSCPTRRQAAERAARALRLVGSQTEKCRRPRRRCGRHGARAR